MEKRCAEMLVRMDELREAKSEYEELDKQFKALLKDEDFDGEIDFKSSQTVRGKKKVLLFRVKRSQYETTRYDIPMDVKAQYAYKEMQAKVTWEKVV